MIQLNLFSFDFSRGFVVVVRWCNPRSFDLQQAHTSPEITKRKNETFDRYYIFHENCANIWSNIHHIQVIGKRTYDKPKRSMISAWLWYKNKYEIQMPTMSKLFFVLFRETKKKWRPNLLWILLGPNQIHDKRQCR